MEQAQPVEEKKNFKDKARRILDPVVALLASMGVSPMLVSIFGLVFSLYGAIVVARGSLFVGGVWLIVAGLCDVLDGSLARDRGSESRFGAFIDSTFDRISELAYFSGLIVYYVTRPQEHVSGFLVTLVCVVLGASFLISYARARLEGLGYECRVGLLERPERLALLILGLLLGSRVLAVVLIILAVGSLITVAQRIRHGYVVTREEQPPAS
jgi:CDP-diacylglycerol--glycerol-3-phosphate 3-phosphatidyltransferase